MDPKHTPPSQDLAAEVDRRTAPRIEIEEPLEVGVEALTFRAKAENVSKSGVLFFTDKDLRVTVELEEDGVVKRMAGRVVRLQSMRGQSVGWAVEFDE